jgi:hypothetical protein
MSNVYVHCVHVYILQNIKTFFYFSGENIRAHDLHFYAVWRTPKIGELVNKLAEATGRARYFMIPHDPTHHHHSVYSYIKGTQA